MKELTAEAQRKNLNLAVAINAQKLPAVVKGDVDRFRQVLVYFTDNAFKLSTNARVEVTAKEGTTIELIVEDFGAGLSEAQLDVRDCPKFFIKCTNNILGHISKL